MSASTLSTLSATDVDVFRKLANPTVVDVQVECRPRRAATDMKKAIDLAASQAPTTRDAPSCGNASVTCTQNKANASDDSVASTPRATKSAFKQAQEVAAAQSTAALTRERSTGEEDAAEASSTTPSLSCLAQMRPSANAPSEVSSHVFL